jgi:hypothetical protein
MNDPIKAKIIEAVPEIYNRFNSGTPDSHGWSVSVQDNRITLPDVLRAIPKHGLVMHLTQHFLFLSYVGNEEILIDWNLTLDWDGQTDEVKKFIGSLLGV